MPSSLVIINLWTSKLFQFRLDLYSCRLEANSIMIVPMQRRILSQPIIQIGREIRPKLGVLPRFTL
jgi:hypothetical protein